MKTFIIERTVPGAGELTEAELAGIAKASNEAIETQGRPYVWLHTYAAGDKLYCVHQAEDEAAVRAHSQCGGFPVDSVTEVANTFDGTWSERVVAA
jgi:hypothetical protein